MGKETDADPVVALVPNPENPVNPVSKFEVKRAGAEVDDGVVAAEELRA